MGAFLTRATQNAQLTRRQACESVVLLRLHLSCFCVPVAATINCRISRDLKERAVALSAIEYDAPTVADILGDPDGSVKEWVLNVATYGAVQRKNTTMWSQVDPQDSYYRRNPWSAPLFSCAIPRRDRELDCYHLRSASLSARCSTPQDSRILRQEAA